MDESIQAFPLSWPTGFERTKIKKDSRFNLTVAMARDGVIAEIGRLRGINVIVSSNIPIKKNGEMYGTMKPVDDDHGVAVYFTWKNDQYVLACDKYYTIQENLRAIEKSIDAMRGLERWGASDILKRAFSGFKAIGTGDPVRSTMNWREILGVKHSSSLEEIKSSYRDLVKIFHPDVPNTGNAETFKKIKDAYNAALNHQKL